MSAFPPSVRPEARQHRAAAIGRASSGPPPAQEADATATAAGSDPRTRDETGYIRFVPRAQAWRTAAEIEG
ncbi:MAG: hypothetical protein M3467_01825, partial [Actinomycetota bacterium]|nr:hypothetical protein [Actinomycetota bacterium]